MTAITPACAQAYQTICLGTRTTHSVHFLKNVSMTIVGGLSIQMLVPVSWMVKQLLDRVVPLSNVFLRRVAAGLQPFLQVRLV